MGITAIAMKEQRDKMHEGIFQESLQMSSFIIDFANFNEFLLIIPASPLSQERLLLREGRQVATKRP